MTEIERLLESALRDLSQKYADELERLAAALESLEKEQESIRTMYSETTKQNEKISKQLTKLTDLIRHSKSL